MTDYAWLDHDQQPIESPHKQSGDYSEASAQETTNELASKPESEQPV